MIKELRIKNFQSHKDSVIRFTPGVNAIVGESDSGKSSIIRSILWTMNNRPLGDAFISFWNRDNDGRAKTETSAEVVFDNGIVTRFKHKAKNGYKVNDTQLETIGTDVPEQVTSLFNMTGVNYTNDQYDKPFLLSESSGEVARYLNRMVKLDTIDVVLSVAEQERRSINKALEQVNAEVSAIEGSLSAMKYLDEAKTLLESVKMAEDTINGLKGKHARLTTMLTSLLESKQAVRDISLRLPDSSTVEHLEKCIFRVKELTTKENTLDDVISMVKEASAKLMDSRVNKATSIIKAMELTIELYDSTSLKKASIDTLTKQLKEMQEKVEDAGDLDRAKRIITKLETIVEEVSEVGDKRSSIEDGLYDVRSASSKVTALKVGLSELPPLPNVCPLCGNKMEECDDSNR